MHLLEKIINSRLTLKKILSDDWNIDNIIDISPKEMEIMYKNTNKNTYLNTACNFTLSHKLMPSHKLHVIYYNFPELNRNGVKINKTCCDKISSLYKNSEYESDDQIFEKDDSIILIINEKISESLENSIENMYMKGQEKLSDGISPSIKQEMDKHKLNIDNSYFRNATIFHLDTLIFNLMDNNYVPKHEAIRDKTIIADIYKQTNTDSSLLPVILKKDPIAKLRQLTPGEICKITRKSKKCGEYIYFRICK